MYPFTYYGSKYRSLNFILDRLPPAEHYVEPFGGSAVVLLNREPSSHEVLNDLNGEIMNFFQVLRDEREELVRRLEATPYSRKEFERAVERRGEPGLEAMERARLFYIRTQQGRYSRMGEGRTKGEWSRSTTTTRGGNPQNVNKWLNKVDGLDSVAKRLRRVQLESRDANTVISDYDTEGALFYVDPPYVPETRGDESSYGDLDFGIPEHKKLLSFVKNIDGEVALSGYDNDLYVEELKGWYVSRAESKTNQNGSSGKASDNSTTQEVLWTSYDPESIDKSPNADSILNY